MSTATLEQPSSTKPEATFDDSGPWPDVRTIADEFNVPEYFAWLCFVFPTYVEADLAHHHEEFWSWIWSIQPNVRPAPFVGIWARGGAKSTSAELGAVALGARGARRYGLYVCGTQDQADDHVGNIASMLESRRVAQVHPHLADRLIGKYGNSKGWRRNRLRTASGFTIDAIGLDTAARGVKLEDQRPDFLVIDDVDSHRDSTKVTKTKIDTLTKALIPAGSNDLAVLAIQNVVHANSIFARLSDGRARFLATRYVSGPIPALHGMKVEQRDGRDIIVGGTPSWVGQDIAHCQQLVDDIGLPAFKTESQHEVGEIEGALWDRDVLDDNRVDGAPADLVRVVVGVDPAGGHGPDSDDTGIVAVGLGVDGIVYVLADRSCHLDPAGWAARTIAAYDDHQGDVIVAERNFGGEMVESTIRTADARVPVKLVHASRGKQVRAEPVAALYAQGKVRHVGRLEELEDQMCTWEPESGNSPDRLDALVWAITELTAGTTRRARFVA